MSSDSLQTYFLTNYLVCPLTPYLQTHEFFKLIMNIFAPFSIILGFFGTLVVLIATPKEMKRSKWVVLNSHIASFYLGAIASVLARPFVYFPSTAIFPTGLFLQLGIPFRVAIILGQTAYPIYEISLVMLFENQYSQISRKFMGSKLRISFFLLHYLFFMVLFIVHLSPKVDDTSAKLTILEHLPCPEHNFFSEHTHVLTLNSTRQSQISAGQSIYLFGLAFFFAISSGYSLLKTNPAMSEKTRELQKKFLLALVVQVLVPFLVLFLPFLMYWIMMGIGVGFHVESSILFICVALHGILSSVLLVLLHRPYREFTLNTFRWKNGAKVLVENRGRRPSILPNVV